MWKNRWGIEHGFSKGSRRDENKNRTSTWCVSLHLLILIYLGLEFVFEANNWYSKCNT